MLKNDIYKLLENEPLTISWQNLDCLNNINNGSIFFGIGLMSRNRLSMGMPFDILSFFFVSEILKRMLNLSKVNVIIADNHAISNNIIDKQEILNKANQSFKIIEKIIA